METTFSFLAGELPKKLLLAKDRAKTGSWEFQLNVIPGIKKITWYLTVVQGRVVFSGNEELSWQQLIKLLKRYIFRLRDKQTEAEIGQIEQEAKPEELEQLGTMLQKIEARELLSREEPLKAVQLQVLDDCDRYLFEVAGEAKFIANPKLVFQAQLPGYNLEDLVVRARERQIEWRKLQGLIPSMQYSPILEREALMKSKMTEKQKQQVTKLVSQGNNFEEIAYKLAKDPLEIAKVFAKLIQSEVVSLKTESLTKEQELNPEIFIVDDSPLMVQQFQDIVAEWGYRVTYCTKPLNAVEEMLKSTPATIFLAINMPEISGFDLIKAIRRQSSLAAIPLVLLTEEKSLSNQLRAQWVNCKFLVKPRAKQGISEFRTELQEILRELAPLPTMT